MTRTCPRALALALALLGFPPAASAQEGIYDMSLEELLQVSITSKRPEDTREAPGIVTVITEQEIRDSGARSLIDVLSLVPGFQVASDYQGTLSLGVRGLWAMEGKTLLMIDGVETNDLYYNTTLLAYSFPVAHIRRVESIRGPGSVIYGGAAEYGVINVITHSGEEQRGARVSATAGQMQGAEGRLGIGISAGSKLGDRADDLDLSVKAFAGRAAVSDRTRTYPDGSAFGAADDYRQAPLLVNARARYRGFTAQILYDRVNQSARDVLGAALERATQVRFTNVAASLSYDWQLSDRVRLSPQYSYRHSIPYFNSDLALRTVAGAPATNGTNFDIAVERHRVALPVDIALGDDLNLLVGVEAYADLGKAGGANVFYPDPSDPTRTQKTLSHSDQSLYAQGGWKTPYGTFTGGLRFERHSNSGNSLVPRFAWTLVPDPWHFKLLYSQAFRNPSVGNLNDAAATGARPDPERTEVLELEAGLKIGARDSVTLNAFNTVVAGPIVYVPATFAYANYKQTGSRGFELVYRHRADWGYSNLGFAYYTAAGLNQVERYAVAQDPTALAGFANLKATWNLSYRVAEGTRLSPTLVFLGRRYGFDGDADADGSLETREYAPSLTASLFLTRDDLLVKGLQLGVGVANLFDAPADFLTPYDLGRNTLPGPGREYLFRVTYDHPF